MPDVIDLNTFAFGGNWQFTPENVVLMQPGGKIRLKFHAAKVHIVAESDKVNTLQIVVDGVKQQDVNVKESRLYTLFDSDNYADHDIEITVSDSGFKAYTFTFG